MFEIGFAFTMGLNVYCVDDDRCENVDGTDRSRVA